MAKTQTGRVVYNRAPHLFSYRDVLRIVRTVEIPNDPERRLEEAHWAEAAVLEASADIHKAILKIPPVQRIDFLNRYTLELLGEFGAFSALIPESAGLNIKELLESL